MGCHVYQNKQNLLTVWLLPAFEALCKLILSRRRRRRWHAATDYTSTSLRRCGVADGDDLACKKKKKNMEASTSMAGRKKIKHCARKQNASLVKGNEKTGPLEASKQGVCSCVYVCACSWARISSYVLRLVAQRV